MSGRTSALGRAAWLAVSLAGAGCVKDPGLTVPSTTGPVVIESFVGTLAVGGSTFYSFTVPQAGNVSLTLVSLTVGGTPSTLSVNLDLGSPTGTTCRTGTTSAAIVAVVPHQTTPLNPGVFCALVADGGTLTDPAAFAVNITRPR